MKTCIRKNCFETNSSSMHSIVVTKDKGQYSKEEFTDDLYIWKDGKLNVWDSELEFGRYPFHILTTFKDKLMYAIASFCGGYTDDEKADEAFDEIEKIAKKYIPELKEIKLPEKRESIFIKEDGTEIGPSGVWAEDDDEFYYHNGKEKEHVIRSEYVNVSPDYGYVDHQSSGLLMSFLKRKHISLEEFLTNKKYVVIIDGDEYCYWETLMKSSLINKKKIAYQYPDGESYDSEMIEEMITGLKEEIDRCEANKKEEQNT